MGVSGSYRNIMIDCHPESLQGEATEEAGPLGKVLEVLAKR